MKTKQSHKYGIGMAGEYFVAAQLHRIGLSASVMYGNAKKADVIVIDDLSHRALVLEVKSSSKNEWIIGNRVPESNVEKIWAFVHIPDNIQESPEFFILSQRDIHDLLTNAEKEYFEKYLLKHGKPYGNKPGVTKLSKILAEPFKDNWKVISEFVNVKGNED